MPGKTGSKRRASLGTKRKGKKNRTKSELVEEEREAVAVMETDGCKKRPRYSQQFTLQRWDPDTYPWYAGDVVYYRPKQRQGVLVRKEDNNGESHWMVKESRGGRLRSVDLSKSLPCLAQRTANENLCSVYVVPDTTSFRQWAKALANSKDTVLEIGCSTGQTSQIFWKQAKTWLGFDNSTRMVETTKSLLAELQAAKKVTASTATCCMVDALMHPDEAANMVHQFGTKPTLVFCDIGGDRDLSGVVQILDWLLRRVVPWDNDNGENDCKEDDAKDDASIANNGCCRTMIVKSESLAKALLQLPDDDCQSSIHTAESSATWLEKQLHDATKITLPRHPLQAALIYNPMTATQPICRYYNYGTCHQGDACELDHGHCHLCQTKDHKATECPMLV